MTGQEDDRLPVARLCQSPLQVETAGARQAYVENQTAGTIERVGAEQLGGRGKAGRQETG